ncbi:conserved protein of unknown function [Limnospira indica PCC 8005]|uniref:Uncharacterized protein n=1 Tax=Limnospira indica PCC 8005 TaxID=376219 RepID=A0A9P1KCY9_9CYAN|nr:conserved protein of unknown function [Limnospira indica PCC 8005]
MGVIFRLSYRNGNELWFFMLNTQASKRSINIWGNRVTVNVSVTINSLKLRIPS